MSTPEPAGKKQIAAKHRDLVTAAEIYDLLDDLPEVERKRVIQWVNDKYNPALVPAKAEPKKE